MFCFVSINIKFINIIKNKWNFFIFFFFQNFPYLANILTFRDIYWIFKQYTKYICHINRIKVFWGGNISPVCLKLDWIDFFYLGRKKNQAVAEVERYILRTSVYRPQAGIDMSKNEGLTKKKKIHPGIESPANDLWIDSTRKGYSDPLIVFFFSLNFY